MLTKYRDVLLRKQRLTKNFASKNLSGKISDNSQYIIHSKRENNEFSLLASVNRSSSYPLQIINQLFSPGDHLLYFGVLLTG